MGVLDYPLDVEFIIKNKRKLKNELLLKKGLLEKRIAILGGSTTSEVKNMLEIFLLNEGIKPIFYESEYNKYYEDALFGNEILDTFKPDIIYIHTTVRNIKRFPSIADTEEMIENYFKEETQKYQAIWKSLEEKYQAIIIQNNFELPPVRILGNKECSDIHGRIHFINRLNEFIYTYAREHQGFFVQDLQYVASCYGLDKWHNEGAWYLYKYACDMKAIPSLSFNLSKIIKSIYGKNKKALALDLDNTLWGGIIGDDGVEGIQIGEETAEGESFSAFQKYLLEQKKLGVLLNVISKNERENALAGIHHPENSLKEEDFIQIIANWEPKSKNIQKLASTLQLGVDSFVFVDDNPAERKEVGDASLGVGIPELTLPEEYIHILDRNGYFEVTTLSQENLKKTELYQENLKREEAKEHFTHYEDYLKSLEMKAEIRAFTPLYLERIAELTNKSNQFNLTTKRYTYKEIEEILNNPAYLTLYGKLSDIFGDNGIVSLIIGKREKEYLQIDLWLMSCRVLKREMEVAMMDTLVSKAKERGIITIIGKYIPTSKNKMVENFYEEQGFTLTHVYENGEKEYKLEVDKYEKRTKYVEVNHE